MAVIKLIKDDICGGNLSCGYLSLLDEDETISPVWAESQQEAIGKHFLFLFYYCDA